MNIFGRKSEQHSNAMESRLSDSVSPVLTKEFLESLVGKQFSMFFSDGELAIERLGSNPIIGSLKSVDLTASQLTFSFDDFITPIFESKTVRSPSSPLKEEPESIKSFVISLEAVSATRMGIQVLFSFSRDSTNSLEVSMMMSEIAEAECS